MLKLRVSHLVLLALMMLLSFACAGRPAGESRPGAPEGPALLMFYTDN